MTDCQRFTLGRESRRPAAEPIRTSEFEVAPIADADEARAFIALHHYAGYASPAPHRFGLYRHGELVGVTLFGPPASMNAHRAVWPTLTTKQAVTLGRLVLLDEVGGNGESWFVSRCFELLASPRLYRPTDKRGRPRTPIVGIESCSDPWPRVGLDGSVLFRGHLGIVYQATNGRYVGRTNDNTIRVFPDGTVLSNRSAGKLTRGERGDDHPVAQLEKWGADPLDPNEDAVAWLKRWRAQLTRPMRHRGNHRYLWCLDRRRRRDVLTAEPLAYPKHEGWTR
jgi:hypothetical protein